MMQEHVLAYSIHLQILGNLPQDGVRLWTERRGGQRV